MIVAVINFFLSTLFFHRLLFLCNFKWFWKKDLINLKKIAVPVHKRTYV